MSRRGQKRTNWIVLVVTLAIVLVALAIVILQFADPATKGRLYGWLPGQPPATAPAVPSNP